MAGLFGLGGIQSSLINIDKSSGTDAGTISQALAGFQSSVKGTVLVMGILNLVLGIVILIVCARKKT